VLFGVGGAILGLVIYVAFALATGWMVGGTGCFGVQQLPCTGARRKARANGGQRAPA
jgi:hypothetical protein